MVYMTKKNPMRGREASMAKLMKAGLEIFSEVGYDAATFRMLSERSGVNESLIVRYFSGKEGLLLAILLDFIENEKEAETIYFQGQNLEEDINNFLSMSFKHDLVNRDFFRIAISRAAIDANLREEVQSRLMTSGASELEKVLETYQKRGEIRSDVNAQDVARTIIHQMLGIKFLIFMQPQLDSQEIKSSIKIFSAQFTKSLKS